MTSWEFGIISILIAVGYFCAGWLWGLRDCNKRLQRLGDRIKEIKKEQYLDT